MCSIILAGLDDRSSTFPLWGNINMPLSFSNIEHQPKREETGRWRLRTLPDKKPAYGSDSVTPVLVSVEFMEVRAGEDQNLYRYA